MILCLVVILLCVLVVVEYTRIVPMEHFMMAEPEFVEKHVVERAVSSSPFFRSMTMDDLQARDSKSIETYMSTYIGSLQEFTPNQKSELSRYCRIIDNMTSFTKLYKDIPWKFAKTSTLIENGYPHTISDIIILTDMFFGYSQQRQLYVLMHEKVHVFQRIHRDLAQSFAQTIGFTEVPSDVIFESRRNNPDLSGLYVYKNNYLPLQVYNKDPTDIGDSDTYIFNTLYMSKQLARESPEYDIPQYIPQIEHPYEIMGCIIPMIIMQERHDDPLYRIATKWVNLHL